MRFREIREVSIEEIRKREENERLIKEALMIMNKLTDDAWNTVVKERDRNSFDPDKLIEPAI